MGNDEYTKKLEMAIQEFIKPLKNLPFHLIINILSGYEVEKFNPDDSNHKKNLRSIKSISQAFLPTN
jgi:restriction endonuclease